MRTVAIASALVVWSAATALAGDAAVSPSTLDSMGLGSMQPMSDHDGLAIRGKGFIDGLIAGIFPDWVFGDLTPPAPPSSPPSPFGDSPFGSDSLLGGFQGGSPNFGSGPSVGGNTFGFGAGFPWPMAW